MAAPLATAALLQEVFPGAVAARPEYLQWLYADSPFGHVIEANLDDDGGRAGHYALVPITLARDGIDYPAALSLNTAVHERARGGGVFVKLATDAIELARQGGIRSLVGVANANSTPGFLRRLDFELLTPLPASVLIPTPGSRGGLRSAWSDAHAFADGGIAADAEALLTVPASGEGRHWTLDTLRWRLARPGARYALHRADDLLAVSCRDSRHGLGVAILLKVFSVRPLSPARTRSLIRAACVFHRAPLALHVGVNELVSFEGIALPSRLRESPLNLIYRSLEDPRRSAAITRFEFLDFDAY